MMVIDEKGLLEAAYGALKHAYAPYSGFCVGAALLAASGHVYTGCNIENASFGVTNCAERTALFKAVSEGERAFCAIAVVGGSAGEVTKLCPPCGVCRQALSEFCSGELLVLLSDGEQICRYTLGELLPASFDLHSEKGAI